MRPDGIVRDEDIMNKYRSAGIFIYIYIGIGLTSREHLIVRNLNIDINTWQLINFK